MLKEILIHLENGDISNKWKLQISTDNIYYFQSCGKTNSIWILLKTGFPLMFFYFCTTYFQLFGKLLITRNRNSLMHHLESRQY